MTRFMPLPAFVISAALMAGSILSPYAAPQAYAAASETEQSEALAFFDDMSAKAFAVLRDDSLTEQEQRAEFRRLFTEVTAVDIIGPLLLGFHRRKFTPEQLDRYTSILPAYVVALYTNRLTEVGDEEVTILKTYTQGSKDVWIVTSVTSPFGGDNLRADWRIHKLDDGTFTLLDVKVENISLFQTKKDEFMGYLSRRSIDDFLDRLEKDAARDAA